MTNKELRDILSTFPDDMQVRASIYDEDKECYMSIYIKDYYICNGIIMLSNEDEHLPEPPKEMTIVKDIDSIFN